MTTTQATRNAYWTLHLCYLSPEEARDARARIESAPWPISAWVAGDFHVTSESWSEPATPDSKWVSLHVPVHFDGFETALFDQAISQVLAGTGIERGVAWDVTPADDWSDIRSGAGD